MLSESAPGPLSGPSTPFHHFLNSASTAAGLPLPPLSLPTASQSANGSLPSIGSSLSPIVSSAGSHNLSSVPHQTGNTQHQALAAAAAMAAALTQSGQQNHQQAAMFSQMMLGKFWGLLSPPNSDGGGCNDDQTTSGGKKLDE